MTKSIYYLNELYSNMGGIGDLSETTFNRILSTLNNSKKDFLIISAFKLSLSRKQAIKMNIDILNALRDRYTKQVGAYKLVGHWKECSLPVEGDLNSLEDFKQDCLKQGGHIVDSLEESLFIRFYKGISSEILSFVCSLAKKYKQEAFIVRINGKIKLYNVNCNTLYTFRTSIGYDALVTSFKALLNKQGYSQWKDDRKKGKVRSIVFEGFYGVSPTTNFGKMAFKYSHLFYLFPLVCYFSN